MELLSLFTPLRMLAVGLFTLIFPVVFLAGSIDHSDIHEAHQTIAAEPFSDPSPGKLYEVSNTIGGSPICFLEGSAGMQAPPETNTVQYYNTLGRAVIVLFDFYAQHVATPETAPRVKIDLTYTRHALGMVVDGRPDPTCIDETTRASRDRQSRIWVVEHVYRHPETKNAFAIKFKEFTVTVEDAESFPRCPLAERPVSIARLRRHFIAMTQPRG